MAPRSCTSSQSHSAEPALADAGLAREQDEPVHRLRRVDHLGHDLHEPRPLAGPRDERARPEGEQPGGRHGRRRVVV